MRWPEYWSFSFNISPSNEHPGLIFFRMDWLDLFAVQGTLKGLLHPDPPSHLPPHPIPLGLPSAPAPSTCTRVNPWLIHVNVWQKPLQYCKVISLQLIKINEKKKSLLQHHSSKASNFRRSTFFTVQLSHPYMTTGKTIALTRRTFVVKVMSLVFNMLSRLVITFLPRSKHVLISWLQSPSAVIFEPPKIKSDTVSTVSPSICHEVMGPDAMILVY